MIALRLAIPAVLAAAAVASSVTYFVASTPPEQEVVSRPNPGIANGVPPPTVKERIDAFEQAAEAILKNAKASTSDASLITGPIPLPKPRPIPR
jgi:hypothetical protein